jgi:hypothetical protein
MRTSISRFSGDVAAAAALLALLLAPGVSEPGASGTGGLAIRSNPPRCALFLDGDFVGMTGEGGGDPLILSGLGVGTHELRATHPGLQDAVVNLDPGKGLRWVLLTLPTPAVAASRPAGPPRIGVGQMIRVKLPPDAPRVARYVIAGDADERRLLALGLPGTTARVTNPRGEDVPLVAAAPVVELPGSRLLELTFATNGPHVLEIGSQSGDFAVVRYLAAPPPLAPGGDGRRRLAPASRPESR